MGIITGLAGLSGAKKQKKIAKRQARAAAAQAEAEKEKQRIEGVRANLQVRKDKQQQFKEARIRRGQILATAINSGTGGSSSTQNALGGIGTQFGANIGQINTAQGFGDAIGAQNEESAAQGTEINRLQGKSAVIAAKQQVIGAAAGLGESIFSRFGPGPGSSFGN